MIARVFSATVVGVDAIRVDVEVDLAKGLPNFFIVGLAEGAVKESRVRVESALKNSGMKFPQRRITVNLAPADLRKTGTAFDLPIALGLISTAESLLPEVVATTVVVGELGLDGEVRSVPGALSMAVMAKKEGLTHMVCPAGCALEASVVRDLTVLPVTNFREVIEYFTGRISLKPVQVDPAEALTKSSSL